MATQVGGEFDQDVREGAGDRWPYARTVLLVAATDLRPALGRTLLWRRDIGRLYAPDPDTALELAQAARPCLCVVDAVELPATVALLRRLRAEPGTRHMGIVALSRLLEPEEEDELRRAGANAVFNGQMDPELWDARLEELLSVPSRRSGRLPVLLDVWSRVPSGESRVAGTALNISVNGMLIETPEPLDLGTKMDLLVDLPDSPTRLRVVGQVARRAEMEERPRCGVKFLVLPGDARERIRRFVESGTSDPPPLEESAREACLCAERSEWEAALRSSETWKDALVDASLDGVVTLDEDGRILGFNRAAERIFGYPRAQVEGRSAFEMLVPPSARGRYRGALAHYLAGGTSPVVGRRVETTGLRADGSEFPVELAVSPMAVGKRRLFTAYVRDITEGKRQEASLRESERQFRALFEGVGDPMVIADDAGRYVDVNPAACSLHARDRQELLGRRLTEFAERGSDLERAWLSLKEQRRLKGEYRLARPNAEAREIEFEITAELLPGRHLVSLRDVTERKQLEAQFRQAQKMEAVGRLAGGVAHDFNNLLGVITGYGELLLRSLPAGSQERGRAQDILKAAARAAGLTRQLLAFSRRQVLQPRVFDLNAVVADVEGILHRLIGDHVTLPTRLDADLGRVKADPGQIEQVLMNLVVNARDAMPGGGTITIETRNADLDEVYAREHLGSRLGPYVLLKVSDDGTGMDAETQRHIFEPFFTTKKKGQGTGLGLATVYGIVKQSGGYIWVDSAPGIGTTVQVFLPRVTEAAEANARPVAESPVPQGGRETVLLVENEDMLRAMMREVLESSGYRVLEAGNGDQAVSVGADFAGPIHLVLTDVIMPGLSGPEAARRLVHTRPDLRVLFTSGYPDEALGREGILEDGIPFLAKPFTHEALGHKVREVLDAQG